MSDRFKSRPKLLMVLICLVMSLSVTVPIAADDGGNGEYPIPVKRVLKYPVLGSQLDKLATQLERGEVSPQEAAEEAAVQQDASVAVTVYLSEGVNQLVQFLRGHGAEPRNVGEDYIETYVPAALLGPLSQQQGVLRVREITPPQPALGNYTSQGVYVHGSEVWNQGGFDGQGIKVGVIDVGFIGFGSLMGTELPTSVVARCYTDIGSFTQQLSDCESYSSHGTDVAETMVDIAPQVSLYIANPTSKADLQASADWMVSQGVSVINHSVTWTYDGPGDGTSPHGDSPLRTVDQVVERGVLWVNSAGNSAEHVWFKFDPQMDENGLVVFRGTDVANNIWVSNGTAAHIQLRWDDSWDNASSDLDLYIRNWPMGDIFTSSEDIQSGRPGHEPFEELSIGTGGIFEIVVKHSGGRVPAWIQLLVWPDRRSLFGGSPRYFTVTGSIGNPAEHASTGMLAVGAAPWDDIHSIESFSSRGPTPDGRSKPDIVGADCGQTSLADSRGFCGTSQASPHVAALAALVRQRFPDFTPEEVVQYLQDFADPRGALPNNSWGYGFAKLPPLDLLEPPSRPSYDDCSTGGAVEDPVNNPGLVSDCNTLLKVRDTLAGDAGLSWSPYTPVEQWSGISVGGAPLHVTELSLFGAGLLGEIPPELAGLVHLETLDIRGSLLTGEVPPELGRLVQLKTLDFGSNQLTGEIPAELGNLSKVERLWLGGNQLTGEVPAELGNLRNLHTLGLGDNLLTGKIPPELGNLVNLRDLRLGDNRLTGEIPAELGNLQDLEYYLMLDGNQLSGELPAELGNLVNVTDFWLDNNRFSGEIPPELGNLSNVEELYLDGNLLTGEIPVELANLTSVRRLWLDENLLTGKIPAELGNLENLGALSLDKNRLTGEIPAELGNLSNLWSLVLDENQLTGQVPEELGNLRNLGTLNLNDNRLTDEIPPALGNLVNLHSLHLSGNQLQGCIPSAWVGILHNDLHLLGIQHCAASEAPVPPAPPSPPANPYQPIPPVPPAPPAPPAPPVPPFPPSPGEPDAAQCRSLLQASSLVIEVGAWTGDCDSAIRADRYARYYTFTLSENSDVSIRLESEVDTYLYLREGEARSGPFSKRTARERRHRERQHRLPGIVAALRVLGPTP